MIDSNLITANNLEPNPRSHVPRRQVKVKSVFDPVLSVKAMSTSDFWLPSDILMSELFHFKHFTITNELD